MTTRRQFLIMSVIGAVAETLPAPCFSAVPLRAGPKPRRIFARKEEGGSWLLYSDAPFEPRQVIRADLIEQIFGRGSYNQLSQRDHWEMIEAGWFSGDDLHQPVPLGDDTYLVWRSFYHPVTEAHDLLVRLFAGKYRLGPFGGALLPNGIALGEHPTTPRYATARVYTDRDLICAMYDVAAMRGLVELVLPDELGPLLKEFADQVAMDDLMWPTNFPTRPSGTPSYLRAADKAQRGVLAQS